MWITDGELSLPVVIHKADPLDFFPPLDSYNEGWEEIQAYPDRHFPSSPLSSLPIHRDRARQTGRAATRHHVFRRSRRLLCREPGLGGPAPEIYRQYYRFLETDDEYFHYSLGEIPDQGRWQICGLYLPPDVLENGYGGNARRILHYPMHP